MKDGTFSTSYRNARSLAMLSSEWDVNSPNCFNVQGAGQLVTKLVTLTAAGSPVAVNLFTISGFIKLFSLFAIFEDVTNVADIDQVYFDVWDGVNQVSLTANGGTSCDGVSLGASLIKVSASGVIVLKLDSDQIRIHESEKNDIVTPTAINAKNGVTNYLRLLYRNVDTNLNCQVRVYAEYRAMCGSVTGLLVPV